MANTITLYFGEEAKNIPVRDVITRKVLDLTRKHMQVLYSHGVNRSLLTALAANPNATKVVLANGSLNPSYVADMRAAISEEHKEVTGSDMPEDALESAVQRKIGNTLIESFPEVFTALRNPDTSIDIANLSQMQSCVEIVKVLIVDGQMSTAEKEYMQKDGFWDDQDLSEVARVVQSFRAKLQQ